MNGSKGCSSQFAEIYSDLGNDSFVPILMKNSR